MKKKLVSLGLGIVGLMLVACTSQDKETKNAEAEKLEDKIYEEINMSNPWVDSDMAGVQAATGFDIAAPEGAVNVAYSYMESMGMAQMNFNLNNAMWVYRMQHTDELEDISGVNCEWSYTEETKVAGMEAMEYGYASEQEGDFIDDIEYTRVINWYDAKNKVTHSVSVIGTDLNGMDTAVYVENLFM